MSPDTKRCQELGFLLFPIEAGCKAPPLVTEWQRKATNDPAQIAEWVKQHPGCNWGIHPADLIVIDEDPRNGGTESLTALDMTTDGLPVTLTAQTPNKGQHFFYKLPEGHPGVPNRAHALGKGIDVKSRGGYVVAAGSRTEKGEYRFVDPSKPIADAPQWLIDRLGTAAPESKSKGVAVPDAAPEVVERAAAWLAYRPGAVEGQGGDAHTYATAAFLRDYGLSEQQTLDLMAETWDARCSPPWGRDGLAEKVKNAYSYAEGTPGAKAITADDFPVVETSDSQAATLFGSEIAPTSKTPFYLFPDKDGLVDLDLAQMPAPRNYVIPNLIPAGITAILAGHGGTDKSLTLLYMGIAVALGRPLFDGEEACEPGAVLIALGEESNEEVNRRLYSIAEQLGLSGADIQALKQRMRLFPCLGKDVRLTGNKNGVLTSTGLAQVIAERANQLAKGCGLPIKMIGLDHVLQFSGGVVNDNEDAALYARETGSLVTATGATVLSVAHSPKGHDDKKLDQHSVLGAVSAVNLARLVLLMQRMSEKEARNFHVPLNERWCWLNLWTGKSNYTRTGKGFWLQEHETPYETVVLCASDPRGAGTNTGEAVMDICEAVIAFLRAEEARGVLHSKNTLEDAASAKKITRGADQRCTRAQVRSATHELEQQGVIDPKASRPADNQQKSGPQTYLKVIRDLPIANSFLEVAGVKVDSAKSGEVSEKPSISSHGKHSGNLAPDTSPPIGKGLRRGSVTSPQPERLETSPKQVGEVAARLAKFQPPAPLHKTQPPPARAPIPTPAAVVEQPKAPAMVQPATDTLTDAKAPSVSERRARYLKNPRKRDSVTGKKCRLKHLAREAARAQQSSASTGPEPAAQEPAQQDATIDIFS